jgi:sucrose-6-phosphate hydrolase SacC (GH32 family)
MLHIVSQCFLKSLSIAILAFLALSSRPAFSDELLFPNADFETGTLEVWEQKGEAFQYQPTQGDNPRARGRETSGHEGQYWIGGFEKFNDKVGAPGEAFGDDAVGEIVSPEFTITRPYITFLIGGGYRPGQAGVRLLCDGQTVELATGMNSETMTPYSHDVSKFLGQKARVVVFDDAAGQWGHINVDSFRATDKPQPDSTKAFAFTDDIPSAACSAPTYDEALRPQFHFTACKNWLNDPNGLVFDGSQYHMFFQHNPLATIWGNMTWGHATSPDMVHWSQRDHALLPYRVDRRVGTIYSGSAVVDHNNSLGVQRGDQKTLCAFFTFAAPPAFYQAMAYSTDDGTTWQYWNEGRPVVENQGFDAEERDPKVFWHEASGQWVMVLWVQRDPGRVRFFTSKNLKDWEFASDLMRDWAFECMDLVFLPIAGDSSNVKAVLYDASFDYEIGTFDGKAFHTESGPFLTGTGNFYAAQTFNNSPTGRVVQIGWMRGGPNMADAYGLPFNHQMSFPCELALRQTQEGPRLFALPIVEIESLVREEHVLGQRDLRQGDNLLGNIEPLDLVDFECEFDPGSAKQVVFQFPRVRLTYDSTTQSLTQTGVNDQGETIDVVVFDKLAPRNGVIKLRFLIDRLSVESYLFDGERFAAHYFAPQTGDTQQSVHAVGGTAHFKLAEARTLNSSWENR